jgi:hypothetical protein
MVGRPLFVGRGWTEQLETPMPHGEQGEATANVRCPCEVEEIKTLTKAGPVQRQRYRSATPGS